MVVRFEDEIGVDQGGPLKHLLSTLVDCFEMGIEDTNKYYENPYVQAPDSDDSYLSAAYLRERLYSFGVFCGELFITVEFNMYDTILLIFAALAVVQANIFPSFVVEWALCKEQDHPFISGLDVLGVARVSQLQF